MTDFPISDEHMPHSPDARSALRFIGESPWTEQDHPSAAYARFALATLEEKDDPRA